MKPMLVDGKLEVLLHKSDIVQLQKAKEVGKLLMELAQDEGTPLVEAIDAILAKHLK